MTHNELTNREKIHWLFWENDAGDGIVYFHDDSEGRLIAEHPDTHELFEVTVRPTGRIAEATEEEL
jgi:hypothetical protein